MTDLPKLDVAERRRSPATMPGYHAGRPPCNKGSPTWPTPPGRASVPLARWIVEPKVLGSCPASHWPERATPARPRSRVRSGARSPSIAHAPGVPPGRSHG
jgi:hypothetical protein